MEVKSTVHFSAVCNQAVYLGTLVLFLSSVLCCGLTTVMIMHALRLMYELQLMHLGMPTQM